MANISGNNSGIHANAPLTSVNLGNLGQAEVTAEGKIRLQDGKTFTVKFNAGGGANATELTKEQKIHLATKTLEILKQSGAKFESLDKLKIESNKITHFDSKGVKQEIKGKETNNWVVTAKNTLDFISRWALGNSKDNQPPINEEQKKRENSENNPESPLLHTITLKKVDSSLMNIGQVFHALEEGAEVTSPNNQGSKPERAYQSSKHQEIEKKDEQGSKISFVEEKEEDEEEMAISLESVFNPEETETKEVGKSSQQNPVSKVSSKSTENIPKKPEVTTEQKEKHLEVSKAISGSNAPPKVLAEKVVNLLGQGEKIEEFKNLHQRKIGNLQEGWVAAKNSMKDKMDDSRIDPDKDKYEKPMSYADFRDEANKFIHSLVNEAAKQMGIGETTTKVFGTPGYNSDKDITFNSADPKKPLTTDEMVLLKSIADMLTTHLMSPKEGLAVLPGTALDTEWYIELKFMGKEVQDKGQKQSLATLDMAMGIVQAKEGLKNEPEKWEEFKKRDLEQTTTKGLKDTRGVKISLYDGVERFYKSLEEDISRELIFQYSCEKGGDPKIIRQNINELQPESLDREIKHIKAEMRQNENQTREKKLDEHETPAGFNKLYYNAKVIAQYPKLMKLGEKCGELEKEIADLKQKVPKDQNKIDELIVEHDIVYALINSRQPEGTMGSSELATTLFSSLGQQEARGKEMASQVQGEVLSKQVKGTKGMLEGLQNLSNIEEKRVKGSSYDISQLILAGQERLGQFAHVISHNDYETKSVINAGKYCLRVAESNYFSLKEVEGKYKAEGKNLPKTFNGLLAEAKEKYIQAKYLEQCKRGFNLNALATGNLIASKLPHDDPSLNLEKKIVEKIQKFEEESSNFSTAKNEKLLMLCKFLSSDEVGGLLNRDNAKTVKFGNTEFLLPTDPELRNILQAFAGYDKKEFQEMQQMTTMKDFLGQLTTEKTVNKKGISDLTKPFKEVIESKKKILEKRKESIEGELKKLSPPSKQGQLTRSGDSVKTTEIMNLNKDLKFYTQLEKKLFDVEKGLEYNIGLVENLNDLSGEKSPEITPLGKHLTSLKEVANELAKVSVDVGDVKDVDGHMESIKKIHEQGQQVVQTAFQLIDKKNVKEFALDVEEFSRKVQNFMFDNKLMPPLADQVPIFSQWGSAK